MQSKVLLIDDHPLLRRGLRQLINDDPELEVVGEAGGGEEGLELAKEHDPDLILLDLNMKGMDGLATLKAIRDAGITTRVVMLTVSDHQGDVAALFKAGADGYLLKDMEPDDLVKNIHQAVNGQLVVDERLAEVMASLLRHDTSAGDQLSTLTARECDIVWLIADGLSNKMIARELNITEGTVKVHVKHLLKKLGVRSRVEAAILMVNSGKR